jgi:hypothetical protein
MPIEDEPYTEQVVLIEGQGIWYYTPESPEAEIIKSGLPLEKLAPNIIYERSHFDFQND